MTDKNYSDEKAYLNYRFANEKNAEYLNFELNALSNIEIPRVGEGPQRLLDLGCGPSIHAAACLATQFDEIYMADGNESCLKELGLWLTKNPASFDWGPLLFEIEKLQDWSSKSFCLKLFF